MSTITVYTDGSCTPNPGKGGWAFIAIFPDSELHVNGKDNYTTNNIMELTAVIEALKELKDHNSFHIFSDSKYVINCAEGKWQKKKNKELWHTYESLVKNKHITFEWVKGHNGNYYNELVDKLSKN
jgi:ribonuclease HI